MTKKEMIFKVMEKHPCVSSAQIHNYVLQMFNENITLQTATSILRFYVDRGLAGRSPNEKGRMMYWFTDTGKEVIANELSL